MCTLVAPSTMLQAKFHYAISDSNQLRTSSEPASAMEFGFKLTRYCSAFFHCSILCRKSPTARRSSGALPRIILGIPVLQTRWRTEPFFPYSGSIVAPEAFFVAQMHQNRFRLRGVSLQTIPNSASPDFQSGRSPCIRGRGERGSCMERM